MCLCGYDPLTPFCDGGSCEWPTDVDDSNIAIIDFLTGARVLSLNGLLTFQQYLDLCVEFDPANPDEEGE